MKKILLSILLPIFLLFCFAPNAFGAIAATTVWEIRYDAAANNINGCGFNASQTSAGTDYSQQTADVIHPTDLAATGTALTSASNPFTAAMVGNLIHITTTGTGAHFVVGWYEIVAYVGAGAVTLDRDPTTGGDGVAGTGYVGGACSLNSSTAGQTDDNLFDAVVAGNKVMVKYDASGGGPHNIVVATAISAANAGTATAPIYFKGYKNAATRLTERVYGADRPTIDVAALGIALPSLWITKDIIITGTATSVFTPNGSTGGTADNIKVINTSATTTRAAVSMGTLGELLNSEIQSDAGYAVTIPSSQIKLAGNYIHGAACVDGVRMSAAASSVILINNVIKTCATAINMSSSTTAGGLVAEGNTLYGAAAPTGTGIATIGVPGNIIKNNIIYGFATGISGTTDVYNFANYNQFYNNTANYTAGYTGFVGANDTIADPGFVDAANGDFRIGTGAKATGYPGSFANQGLNAACVGYKDPGAVQRIEPAATGGGGAWSF